MQTLEPLMVEDKVFWQRYAEVYDALLEVIPYRNLLLELIDHAGISNDHRVLDICCGTANLLWALKQRGLSPHVTGIDYSESMLEQANLKKQAFDGTVDFCRVNLDEPLSPGVISGLYDRLIINNALYALRDPAEALIKFGTLAAPGAILVVSTPRPHPSASAVLDEHIRLAEAGGHEGAALRRLLPQLNPLIACNKILVERYGNTLHFPSEAQLHEWFKGSGWKIDHIGTNYVGQNWLIIASKMP